MRFLALFLCSLPALQPIWASAEPDPTDGELRVHLVDDPGPAQPHSASAKGYIIQITNAAGAPVVGSAVALRLPEDGATGRFANGLRAWVAYSDAAGIVRFPVIQWSATPGPVQIQVTAAKGSTHSGLVIAQRINADNGSLSVVSVPIRNPDTTVANPPPTTSMTSTISTTSAITLGIPRRAVLYFQMPQLETAQVAAPQRPPTPTPQVALDQPTLDISQLLADIVPPSLPAQDTPLPPMNISHSGSSAPPEKPHTLKPEPPPPTKESSSEPTVTITNSPTGAGGESHKKMWILIGIGAGAGAAAMLGIMAAHSSAGAAAGAGSSTGVTVGTPTITLGH
jgi:hypothetical protein